MARTDTLSNFLTDVADSIRTKKGTTDKILASSFDTEIESIETVEDYMRESDLILTLYNCPNYLPSERNYTEDKIKETENLMKILGGK